MQNGTAKTSSSKEKKMAPKEPSVEELTEQVETLKNDVSALVSLLGDLGKAESKRAVHKVKERGETVKNLSEEQIERVRASVEGYRHDAEVFVRDKPEMALGIAAGLGLLVGMLLTRRG